MPYVPIDENLPEHRKVLALPFDDMNAALGLLIRAWCYCSRNLSDGFVPDGFFRTQDDRRLRDLLMTDYGFGLLFDEAENGITVHDYLDCNKSREEVEAYKDAKRAAGAKGGKRSGEARKEAKPKQVLDGCLPSASSKTNPSALASALADTKREEIAPASEPEVSDSKPPAALGNFPACMTADKWREGNQPFASSREHILRAVEAKHGIPKQSDIGALGKAISECCPSGCLHKTSDTCARVVIEKIGKAPNLRLAADWYRKDRGPTC